MSTSLLARSSLHAEQQYSLQEVTFSSIPLLIEKRAAEYPQRSAVVGTSNTLTYAELNLLSDRLAHLLRTLGVGPEVRIAVYMSRSPFAVVGALGVLKAGGAYLPIDEKCPAERLSYILSDAEVPLVLTDLHGSKHVPEGSWRVCVVDDVLQSGSAERSTAVAPKADDLAYIIYTSGTTGNPKGVEISHSNLANLVQWHVEAFGVTPADKTTQFASLGFDAAVWEIWPNLASGATVYFVPDEVRTLPKLLRDWLVEQQITISFIPTALAEQLVTSQWPLDTKLRLLLTGADTLHYYPVSGLPFQLINNYGPTETTVVATSTSVPKSINDQYRPPIGRPIRNTQIYICDEFPNLVPEGQVGELYIGGASVGRGYVNKPDLTAQKFLPDPFSGTTGARVYRTGDLGRLLPDGQISFLGRVDDQIKLRGYRIEPNEIVDVLNSHPMIEASAVVAREEGSSGGRLVAYVIPIVNSVSEISVDELRKYLSTRLPDYMVPAVFVSIASLPVTLNGKVDRAALPVPDGSNILRDELVVNAEPRSLIEQQLVASIAELLGLQEVGLHDNFFLIGGHSLFGAQLIARIQDTFGLDLPLRSVFDSPTVAQLAQQIETLMVKNIESMSEDEAKRALQQDNSITS
jgi:amino acid adenylation domain-containing protein